MNSLFLSCVLIYCLTFSKANCQSNFRNYYTNIDSADFFRSQGKIDSANFYYHKAFNENVGFDTDYATAIFSFYLEHKTLDTITIAKSFSIGEHKREIFELCKRRHIPFSKKQIRKIYRDNKFKPVLNPKTYKWMMFRDQLVRRYLPKKMTQVDYKNSRILIRLMHEKPSYFDHKNLSLKNYGRLETLLIHAGWKNLNTEFNVIQTFTKEGKLNRLIGASIIERAAIYHGFLFKIDSIGQIKVLENQSKVLCDFFYPNIYFNYSLKFDKKNKQLLFPPFNSNLTEQEVDSLRQFLFLCPLIMLYQQQQFRFVSSDEFCNFKNE